MSSLNLVDLTSRTKATPMADGKPKKKWIAKATENSHGQFRAKAEKAGETTRAFAKEHDGDSGKLGQQARLAENLMGISKKKRARDVLYDRKKKD